MTEANKFDSPADAAKLKKAVIPIAGLGTRFLPLSKMVPKELWPLVDKPIIQYIVEEAKLSGISEIIFVVSPDKKSVSDYFKESPAVEKILKDRKKNNLLAELKDLKELCQGITFSFVTQQKPLGDGHAILQAKDKIGQESTAVLFADDVVDSRIPCLSQLQKVFKTCQKPVLALYRLPKERLPFYGIVAVEKIANRFYKIKKIAEKPTIEEAPSDLAIVGKYILTPEVFDCLQGAKPGKRGEIILGEVLDKMLKDGQVVYGYEFDGQWLECGNKLGWLKSHLYLSMQHKEYGPELKKYLKEIKNL
jgi:UTP--glucose-1-phosphate uridylyltransferase